MYCLRCGNKLGDNEKYCAKCGADNRKASMATKAQALTKHRMPFQKLLIPIVIAVVVLFTFVIGCNLKSRGSKSGGSPEKAIEAYYTLLADGDLEGMADLIPKDKQKLLEEAVRKNRGNEYGGYEDLFRLFADVIKDGADYSDYIWEEMAPGMEDGSIYRVGDIEIRDIDEETEADLLTMIDEALEADFCRFYRNEEDMFDTMRESGTVNGYDSDIAIEVCEYDELRRYEVKITTDGGEGRNTDTIPTYVYKYDGEWWNGNILLFFCYWLMEG